MRKADVILILTVFMVAVIFVLVKFNCFQPSNDSNLKAKIFYKDKLSREISLDDVEEYQIFPLDEKEVRVVFEAEEHKIRFQFSDCPDKLCVDTGWVSQNGDIAICMPNNTRIEIGSDSKPKP